MDKLGSKPKQSGSRDCSHPYAKPLHLIQTGSRGDPEKPPGKDEAQVLGMSRKELAKERGRQEVHSNQRAQHMQRSGGTKKPGAPGNGYKSVGLEGRNWGKGRE